MQELRYYILTHIESNKESLIVKRDGYYEVVKAEEGGLNKGDTYTIDIFLDLLLKYKVDRLKNVT